MATKISFGLSVKEIEAAKKQIQEYQKSLDDKCELFVRRLSEIGIPVIDEKIMQARGDSDITHYNEIKVQSFGDYSRATLSVSGKDLLFIEFGAGIHYNDMSKHPLASQLGYTIGSYGKGLGKNDSWYYIDDNGDLKKSYGTEATMPVYNAAQEMRYRMVEIASEVFGGGS